jgi:hypothetical protein
MLNDDGYIFRRLTVEPNKKISLFICVERILELYDSNQLVYVLLIFCGIQKYG